MVDNDASSADQPSSENVGRTFGQMPNLIVPAGFDAPLPLSELAAWEGAADPTS